MDLNEYQRRAAATDQRDDPTDLRIPLLGLAGEVGELVSEYKKRIRSDSFHSGFEAAIEEELGDLLWYVAAVARSANLSLSEIAAANLSKVQDVFGDELRPPSRYDEEFPDDQRFPRQFTIKLATWQKDGIERVQMMLDGEPLGADLDDNTYVDDAYRFHDVLHLANAAVLGWSPTLRSLMKRKRRNDEDIDRVEDGGRAIAIEKGLVAYLFTEAREVGFFEGADRVSWDLIKTLRRMTAHLEVGDQPHIAWQSAILQGFAAWRHITAANGGTVRCDLDQRTVEVLDGT